MLSYRQEYWWWGSAGLAAAWFVISQVVGRPGGLRSSSIGCLQNSVIPAGPRGRVITAQTGDNYQSEAGSQLRRWEGPKPQDRKHHGCGRWMSACSREQLDHHSGQNKEANEASGEPAANGNTGDGAAARKKKGFIISSQHMDVEMRWDEMMRWRQIGFKVTYFKVIVGIK